jgi:hypothetical protein
MWKSHTMVRVIVSNTTFNIISVILWKSVLLVEPTQCLGQWLISIFMWKSHTMVRVKVMAFNATFNNISVISWQSVLLVEPMQCKGQWPKSIFICKSHTMSRSILKSLFMWKYHTMSRSMLKWIFQASTLTFVRLSCTSENWCRTNRFCTTVVRQDRWKKWLS